MSARKRFAESPSRARVVLVVDDDDMIRRLVRTVLEADDLEVIDVPDGPSALRAVATLGPDGNPAPTVVVLDVMMPGMDGIEVCRQIDHSLVKVVMLTARDDPDIEARAKDAGADEFLTKPFGSIELLDLVERLLTEQGAA